MMLGRYSIVIGFVTLLSGCSGLEFSDHQIPGSMPYYETIPTGVIKTGADCSVSFDVVNLPGGRRWVRFKSGYGSSKLGITLANGMLQSVNQETDSKIPETITAVGGLVKDAAGAAALVKGNDAGSVARPCPPSLSFHHLMPDGTLGPPFLAVPR